MFISKYLNMPKITKGYQYQISTSSLFSISKHNTIQYKNFPSASPGAKGLIRTQHTLSFFKQPNTKLSQPLFKFQFQFKSQQTRLNPILLTLLTKKRYFCQKLKPEPNSSSHIKTDESDHIKLNNTICPKCGRKLVCTAHPSFTQFIVALLFWGIIGILAECMGICCIVSSCITILGFLSTIIYLAIA